VARIDVSELMRDPDFLSSVTLIRRTNTVASTGEVTVSNGSSASVSMVVQPGAGDMLERLPESVRSKELITLWYKSELYNQATTPGNYADIVVWRGRRFVVEHVEPFDNWGRGYYQGVASLEALSA
jgi:hypothetical protein